MSAPAPHWVSFDADQARGLDLLGLRAPVQAISNGLLNGLTSVTPKVRYISVLAWIIWRYGQSRLPDDWTYFAPFAAAQEAAIVMANLLRNRSTSNLVGHDKALSLIESGKLTLPLEPLAKGIASDIYASAARQLHITCERNSGIDGLVKERGLPLALAFDKTIGQTAYGSRLAKAQRVNQVRREHLEELAKAVSLDTVPQRERSLLIDAIVPATPLDGNERRRVATFALLLWLTAHRGRPINETDVFAAASEPPRRLPYCLRAVLDGWLDYVIRDLIAVTHEAVLEAVMREVDIASARRGGTALVQDVVAALVGAIDDHDNALRHMELLKRNETVRTLTFDQIWERVERACTESVNVVNGLRRWKGGLAETALYGAALDIGPQAAAVLPIAWCLAALRTSRMPPASSNRLLLSIGDFFQIGLAAIVLPGVEEFCHEKRRYLDVMAELVMRTVQQHLRVAWSRFAAPQGKDVAVLVADLETWSRHNTYRAGRTESRLGVAIDWLAQLELTEDRGISVSGRAVLERTLSTLASDYR